MFIRVGLISTDELMCSVVHVPCFISSFCFLVSESTTQALSSDYKELFSIDICVTFIYTALKVFFLIKKVGFANRVDLLIWAMLRL